MSWRVKRVMVESSQDLPGDAQAVFDSVQRLLFREGKFDLDRPRERERDALCGKKRVALAMWGRGT
jgi:hypothetical protein